MKLLLTIFILNNLFAESIELIPIASNEAILYEEPFINSKVIRKLNLGDKVKVEKKRNKIESIKNEKIFWSYIKTEICEEQNCYEGWVRDQYLAYKDRYKRISIWNFKTYSNCIGEWCPQFNFSRTGKYTLQMRCIEENDYYGDCSRPNISKGQLYKYLDLIQVSKTSIFLFISKDGKLCIHPYEFSCQ